MPTLPFGDTNLYAVVKQKVTPMFTDVAYRGTPFLYRLLRGNRKVESGAPHVEFPVLYQDLGGGDWYSGYDVMSASPTETVRNAFETWKRLTVPIVLDSDTLWKANSADSIANIVIMQAEQARMRAQNLLSTATLTSDGSNVKQISGLPIAVDSTGTYLGLNRASLPWWAANEDATTAVMSLPAINSMFNLCSEGGRHTSLILSDVAKYEQFWALGTPYVQQDMGPTGRDEQLFSAGFTNLLFNTVPWVIDKGIVADTTTTRTPIFMLNESYWDLYVGNGHEFTMSDFMRYPNQQVYIAEVDLRTMLVCRNPKRQGKLTNIA